MDIALDGSGRMYVVGTTFSEDLPTTRGAFDRQANGNEDVFVAKLSADGRSIEYATYLGGAGEDRGHGITVDGAGHAYVVGTTSSTDFPTTADAAFPEAAGSADVFVARLSRNGRQLDYSTFLGGSFPDHGAEIAADAHGSAYVTGFAGSADFPTTAGAFDTTSGGGTFAAKLTPNGSALAYSTFLRSDFGRAIAVTPAGTAYVVGFSGRPDFPLTPGAFDTTVDGLYDAFITAIRRDGSSLLYSTLLGGSTSDDATDVEVDASGRAYVSGTTDSPDFPVSHDAFDTALGDFDAFITQINPRGTGLLYSTFLGGSGFEFWPSIALGSRGRIYVVGSTMSDDFPTTTDGAQIGFGGVIDGFLVQLVPGETRLRDGTFLGGSDVELAYGIGVTRKGDVSLTGLTASSDFPITPDAVQPTHVGPFADAFVARLGRQH